MNVRGLGSVLSRQATGHTLAHEIMHECGLFDIYNNDSGLSVSGAVGPGRLSDADWGGGYYPPGLAQRALAGGGTVRTQGNAGVGQSTIQRNPGSY